MTIHDSLGHAVSGASAAALDHYEHACHELRCFIGDPLGRAQQALSESPEMTMGHLLVAYLNLLGTEPAGLQPRARRAAGRARAAGRRARAGAPPRRRASRGRPLACRRRRARGPEHRPSAGRVGAAGGPPGRLLHRPLAHAARPHRARRRRLAARHAGLSRGARHARIRPGGNRRLRARRGASGDARSSSKSATAGPGTRWLT